MAATQDLGALSGQELLRPLLPVSTTETVNAMAHYHRAEIARMAGWRDRIDRTTNWAITVSAAMLSVSLSTTTAHHSVLLFGMLVVLLLLVIEARRYRFFDVYRARVRQMERHYFAQVLAPNGEGEADWARLLGENLRRPVFLISLRAAISRRLRRNYVWMFLILLMAWVLKISSSHLQPEEAPPGLTRSLEGIIANAALGPLPGWLVVLAVAGFYGWIAYRALRPLPRSGELAYGDVHV